jgi:hypothetical protein
MCGHSFPASARGRSRKMLNYTGAKDTARRRAMVDLREAAHASNVARGSQVARHVTGSALPAPDLAVQGVAPISDRTPVSRRTIGQAR